MTNIASRRSPVPVPAVLRKVGVAVLTGLFVYLITQLAPLDQADGQLWALALSAFLGGVVLVVQFLADFANVLKVLEEEQTQQLRDVAARQAEHTDQMREIVQQSFLKINRATKLFGQVEASALRDPLIDLMSHAGAVREGTPRLVTRIAHAEIDRICRFLKDLGHGTVSYPGEDRDWLLTLAHNATVSIDATSLNTVDARGQGFDSSFWQSDLGQRYLEEQRETMVRHGVKVRRVFVVDKPGVATSPEFQEMCRMQARMGIEVRILSATDLERPLKTKLLDFVLFDNTISYETTPAYRIDEKSLPEIVHTLLQLEPEVIEERIVRYRDLWERATPFEVTDPAARPATVAGPPASR